jgi:restriction endonuclease
MNDPKNGHQARLVRIEEKIKGMDRELALHVKSLKEATSVARSELERRLEGMNEFREQLNSQAATFMSRQEIGALFEKVELKTNILEKMSNQRKGSKQWTDHIITVLIGLGVVVAIKLL